MTKQANTKLKGILYLLLVVIAACLADADTSDMADGIHYGSSHIYLCERGQCGSISYEDIEKNHPEAFKSEEDINKDDGVIPIVKISCLFAPKGHGTCPQCTWTDTNQNCPTCLFYALAPTEPTLIGTSEGTCYAIHLGDRYQYTLYGLCRSTCNIVPKVSGCSACVQEYDERTVVCLKLRGTDVSISLEQYMYPTNCACSVQGG